MAYRNEFSLGDAIKQFMRENGLDAAYQAQRLVKSWVEIAGEAIAAQTTEVSLNKGVLLVRISHPIWRQEVSQQREQLREAANRFVQMELVQEVRVV